MAEYVGRLIPEMAHSVRACVGPSAALWLINPVNISERPFKNAFVVC